MFKKKCLTDIEKIMDELEAENLAFLQDDSSQCSTGRGATLHLTHTQTGIFVCLGVIHVTGSEIWPHLSAK
jgi:hypothetical protein